MITWSDDRILKKISPEMERFYSGFTQSIRDVNVMRLESAIPHHDIGKSARIAEYREAIMEPSVRPSAQSSTLVRLALKSQSRERWNVGPDIQGHHNAAFG